MNIFTLPEELHDVLVLVFRPTFEVGEGYLTFAFFVHAPRNLTKVPSPAFTSSASATSVIFP